MGRYRLTRRIKATPERVFDGFTNPGTVTDWMDLAEIKDLSGPLDTPGTRFTMVVRGPWRFRSQIVRSDRPRIHESSGRGPFGASYRMVATLRPNDDGTELDLATDYALPFGPFGRWIDRRWVDREPRTIANRELDRLVDLVSESQA